ncbi:protein FAR-RED IMPAIRED RESPONSE 1-like [Chenopodium quinoa]|uniref:protein FAR-RED IMPAIRED RESPONSE 1-like n=1 Tax=Chenopodium quinoa TaxID=63459 RepID=UPI000B79517D|nr:protein FAR-RED IMPAIRED RESPONSE 1-like [Chenopodium quinoa]
MSESIEYWSSFVTTEDNNVRIFKTPTQPLLPKIYYNSGGDKEYIACSSENKPFVGMIFDTLQDGIAFYYKYANECGFKVRSSTTKSQKNKNDPTGKGVTIIKYLLCSKEGYVTNNKKPGKQVEGACLKRMTVKRVSCPAKIKFRFCTGGKIMKELCVGFQNVTGSKNDFKNFSRDLKVYISNVDGAMHLTRVFWADAIGRRDYQLFGDSLSFDSTYDTNKYSLVFCLVTGVDNHKRCVTFCVALFSKEDIDSFVWLFQTFLKCMGREPSCIITNQDHAMGIAIEKVFTKTKHRLCMWHIMRKVPEKAETAFCNEIDFLKKLSALVWDREIDPRVFVDDWNSVMEEFNLVDHEWFAYMFKIKHLWILAYFRDLFMGGLLCSTSRSEGENNFFCNFTNPHVTCVEFFVRYETALDAQRHEQDELYMLNKLEPQLVTNLHLEKHDVVVYTRCIFYDFQEECQEACFHVVLKVVVLCMEMLFVMKGKCIREIPDAYILNRWRKDVLKKASVIDVAMDDASKYDKKKQLVSDVWSKIFSCVSLTDQYEDDLSELIRTLSSFEEQMISKNNPENAPSSKEVKDADIQVLVGSNEVDVNVLPPNQCLNKGSARSSKRLKSAKEIATEEKSKKGRTCRACGLVFPMTVETVQTSSLLGILLLSVVYLL